MIELARPMFIDEKSEAHWHRDGHIIVCDRVKMKLRFLGALSDSPTITCHAGLQYVARLLGRCKGLMWVSKM